MNELRKDPLTGNWMIIGERIGGKRPFSYEKCPFCPGQEAQTPPAIYTLNDNGNLELEKFQSSPHLNHQ